MSNKVKLDTTIFDKLITLRNQQVLIDADVAEVYGVETKRINEAVKNNLDKFPEGYLIELNSDEWSLLKSKFSISNKGGKTKLPTAFTEKGLYMLATILKSPQATIITIDIIETFAKLSELNRAISTIPTLSENFPKQEKLLARAGELMANLINTDEYMN